MPGEQVLGRWKLVSDNGMFALFDEIGIPLPKQFSMTWTKRPDGTWTQSLDSENSGSVYIFNWDVVQEKVIYGNPMKVQHILKGNTITEIRQGVDAKGNPWKLEAERVFTGNKMVSNYTLGDKTGSSEFEKVE